ncbi:hypothetical protein ACMFMG_012139 [Clarireedia jacksonii]
MPRNGPFPKEQTGSISRNASEFDQLPAITSQASKVWQQSWKAKAPSHQNINLFMILTILILTARVYVLSDAGCIHPFNTGFKPETPIFSSQQVMFMNDSRFANDEMWVNRDAMMEVLHNWAKITPRGHGLVSIDHPEEYGLEEPILIKPTGKSVSNEPFLTYQISVFHSIHCLSAILYSHAELLRGEKDPVPQDHITHCFDYLRQSIMCTAHTKLEGDSASRGYIKPWGTMHTCANYDEVIDWANQISPWEFPPDSVL